MVPEIFPRKISGKFFSGYQQGHRVPRKNEDMPEAAHINNVENEKISVPRRGEEPELTMIDDAYILGTHFWEKF